jgi:hypothetical protein
MDGFPDCKCTNKTSDCSIHPSTPDEWIASQAAFLAKTYQRLEEARVLPANDQDSGRSSLASFAWYDPDTHSLRTVQCSLLEASTLYSETLPRWGSMRSGRLYQQPIPALRIGESASGSWPTPVAHDDGKTPEAHMRMKSRMKGGARHTPTSLTVMVKGIERGLWPTPQARDYFPPHKPEYIAAKKAQGHGMSNLNDTVAQFPTPRAASKSSGGIGLDGGSGARSNPNYTPEMGRGGSLSPTWVEWLMGWPLAYTVSKHWATAKSRSKPRSRGKSSCGA